MQVNVAGLRRNIKNIACNFSEAQIKVREATSNDPWGPSALMLSEIADLTFNVVEFPKIMDMIWRRLNDTGKNWRHVKKALILMEYLTKAGVEKCVKQCRENIFAIEALRDFVYYEDGKDYGRQVREKANQLVNLLRDNERLRNERCKALKAKERFARFSSGFGYNDVLPVTKPNSELESVRPKTFDEEELQIKLALDMSREEAKQEQLKRRTDDVRLKLALEQSERDFEEQRAKQPKEEPQSHLLDLLDISLGAASSSRVANFSDPWTSGNASTVVSWPQHTNAQIDPWQPSGAVATNRNNFVSTSFETASGPTSYGWLNKNASMLTSTWPPSTNTMQPLNGCTCDADYFSNQTVVSTMPQKESVAAINRNKNNFFEDLDNSTTTPIFVAPNHSVTENPTNTQNADPYTPLSSFNPFL